MRKLQLAHKILAALKELYPNAKSELNYNSPYQLLVAVMLSAQCTDKKVNEITPILFARFDSFQSLTDATQADLEYILRPINYYKTKSKHLLATADIVTNRFANKLPSTLHELCLLPGVGRKTASVFLGELGIAHTLPVDTHVMRVAGRLALTKHTDALKVEKDLSKIYLSQEWRHLHHGLILHGRRICKARNPACGICSLASLCAGALRW